MKALGLDCGELIITSGDFWTRTKNYNPDAKWEEFQQLCWDCHCEGDLKGFEYRFAAGSRWPKTRQEWLKDREWATSFERGLNDTGSEDVME
jgi:hypothetical protein